MTSANDYANNYQTYLDEGGGPESFLAVVDKNFLKDGLCYNLSGSTRFARLAGIVQSYAYAATFASLYQSGLSTMGLLRSAVRSLRPPCNSLTLQQRHARAASEGHTRLWRAEAD